MKYSKEKQQEMAEYIHNYCVDACACCPQFDGFDESSREIIFPDYRVCVAKLPETEGLYGVLKYWRNPDSIGGGYLWRLGYHSELPNDVRAFLGVH